MAKTVTSIVVLSAILITVIGTYPYVFQGPTKAKEPGDVITLKKMMIEMDEVIQDQKKTIAALRAVEDESDKRHYQAHKTIESLENTIKENFKLIEFQKNLIDEQHKLIDKMLSGGAPEVGPPPRKVEKQK